MKLSIVTINFNNAGGLKKTIDSVAAQTYREYEHIIVDGNRTKDDSVRIIQEYDYAHRKTAEQQYPIIRWISDNDNGIYAAMNKGIRMAQGEYILMLNSGDSLVDAHVLERIVSQLDGIDIVQGNTIEEHEGKTAHNRGYGRSEITMRDVMEGDFLHQASFCRRDLFVRYGYFDESYAIVADKKFFMTCLGFHDVTFKYVDIDVANFDTTGISSATSGEWSKIHEEENERLRNELFSSRLRASLELQGDDAFLTKLNKHKWILNITKFLLRLVK